MKNAINIGMLATVVFAVGMVGINFSDGTFVLYNETPTSTMESGSLLGHIEIYVKATSRPARFADSWHAVSVR